MITARGKNIMSNQNKNDLKKYIQVSWDAFKNEVKRFIKSGAPLIFIEEKKDDYAQIFNKHYDTTRDAFMNTPELDGHKQTAIVIISCLECNAMVLTEDPSEGNINILPQIIAVNIGLSYMNNALNNLLSKMNKKKSEKYLLPVPFACNTPYYEIMCRLLYYEQTRSDMSYNVLELADRLFLLEYINLLQCGIDPLEVRKFIQDN